MAQFACVSLWFASNGVMPEMQAAFGLSPASLGHLTSAVQLGFIGGTLLFAFLAIADRFPAPYVFFVCAILGAAANAAMILEGNSYVSLVVLRALTGFFLAGIYPVGMKIAADYYPGGLGRALGYLLGALVIGTAFPHFARSFLADLPWSAVVITSSILSVFGGLLLLVFAGRGKVHTVRSLRPGAVVLAFRDPEFRAAAMGYFGHMWELYAFWAFVPVILGNYLVRHNAELDISLSSFSIIAIGAISCVMGGIWSGRAGSDRIAIFALATSGLCCLISPLIYSLPITLFLAVLLIWGMAVIADSPQFSTLVARAAPAHLVGSALTMVNCIGFAITIVSIQLLTLLNVKGWTEYMFLLIVPGPIFGCVAMYRGYLSSRRWS